MIERVKPIQTTAANWADKNPVLLSGERGYETDTGKEKSGDGITPWNSLPYRPTSSDVEALYGYTDHAVSLVSTGGEELPDLNLVFENGLI